MLRLERSPTEPELLCGFINDKGLDSKTQQGFRGNTCINLNAKLDVWKVALLVVLDSELPVNHTPTPFTLRRSADLENDERRGSCCAASAPDFAACSACPRGPLKS